jgi:hypothetical protein
MFARLSLNLYITSTSSSPLRIPYYTPHPNHQIDRSFPSTAKLTFGVFQESPPTDLCRRRSLCNHLLSRHLVNEQQLEEEFVRLAYLYEAAQAPAIRRLFQIMEGVSRHANAFCVWKVRCDQEIGRKTP